MHHLNTHYYDTNIDPVIINSLTRHIATLSIVNKQAQLVALRHYFDSNPVAQLYFDTIVTQIAQSTNVDRHTTLAADDLLLLLSQHVTTELITELAIQLADMSTGNCPQGRVYRLLQLVLAFCPDILS